ncbi:MAG: MerR family transcriptional regulator [Trueperaceae bacterium]|nr:MerR family transcriptional regulator [Trueperaceae bacterium]
MDGMTISALARATGFTAPTIRYYERIDLLPAPRRSASGYRLYDDDAIEALHFVRRAKRLGLSLDDTAELLGCWSEGACSMTREELQRLLASKLEEVRHRIEELRTLGAHLEDAYGRLMGHPPSGPCGPGCGCPPDVADDADASALGTVHG